MEKWNPMANFTCQFGGLLQTYYDKRIGFNVITPEALTEFWSRQSCADNHGVYVFALKGRGPGAAFPYYVGKADKTNFCTETFNKRNRKAYTAALLQGDGRPEIHLIPLSRGRGPFPRSAIDDLETLLIWVARHRNHSLINKRKIDSSPKHILQLAQKNTVRGVLNSGSGKIHSEAQRFRAMMGL
jgi:hypothetical protein